ncbi:hypothetical protein DW028_09045 [Agathobacter rectalis]|uniref:Peptidase M10 metallopeptidase domain-containing protein n=1 Tax=Agathobacter rectalis TaxID=39491 RepID=A0A415JVU2_9FIRM|nr:hypothetical protein [Agathobacter rectalis]RHL28189.1 hypothetical protein DW028_09045 [Agathobacter rectalis]
MKKIRYFIVSTIVLCMIFASTIVTYAADPYLSFGSKTGNVNVKKYADKYNDTWYGLTSQTYNSSTGYTTKFTIKVNARTISEDATNFNNFAKSTVTHEFGHVFWLCDNPNTSKSSIMKYSRNRNSMTAPQTFDVDNVNAKYD